MTNQVMRRANQLLTHKTADLGEDIVAIGDPAFEVGRGNQTLLVRKGVFTLGDRLVVTHWVSRRQKSKKTLA
ncbi:hypothetical protein D3C77_749810 [compost metagenome]